MDPQLGSEEKKKTFRSRFSSWSGVSLMKKGKPAFLFFGAKIGKGKKGALFFRLKGDLYGENGFSKNHRGIQV
jgi:hypothetical protein